MDDGKQINLHSSYNPEREATRFIDSCEVDRSLNFIAGGFGLGYHLLELAKRVSSKAKIIVFEKNIEIIHLAFEQIDLRPLLTHPGFSLQIANNNQTMAALINEDPISFVLNGYVPVTFKPLVEADLEYYQELDQVLQKALQEARINLKTRSVFSKRYYQNILDNLPHLISCPGIIPLENKLQGLPAILVSAGPSLDKNLPLLKTASKRALIIAVATAFHPLLSNNIYPDFVVAVDPDETSIRSFNLESFSNKSLLLFDPSLPPPIIKKFKGRKITIDSQLFLSQWISRYLGEKGILGKSLSVAHTGYLFARYLGCDPIILTGQDLAFCGITSHCRKSYFENLFILTTQIDKSSKDNRREHFQKYRNALQNVYDIFGGLTRTTLAMDAYKNLFTQEINKKGTVYNATEGGVEIPGIQSISLKEGINRICQLPRLEVEKYLNFESNHKNISNLIGALKNKISTLSGLKNQLNEIRSQFENNQLNEITFIKKMEGINQSLIRDDDMIRLLQDYAYAEFLQWYQHSHEIYKMSEKMDSIKIMRAKLNRDRKFLEVLIKTTDSLISVFNDSVKQIDEG